VAWLSLDVGDTDPARFWCHAMAALDQARPGVADRVEPLLGPSAAPSFEQLLTTLINELAGADEVLLVLDDYRQHHRGWSAAGASAGGHRPENHGDGRISPRSSNTITPLQSRLHPCSG